MSVSPPRRRTRRQKKNTGNSPAKPCRRALPPPEGCRFLPITPPTATQDRCEMRKRPAPPRKRSRRRRHPKRVNPTSRQRGLAKMLASQRALFEMPRDICYLNSASWSPLPLRTLEAGRAAVGRKGRPWTLDADFASGQHERARNAAARLIEADASDIALIPSISYGVATAA